MLRGRWQQRGNFIRMGVSPTNHHEDDGSRVTAVGEDDSLQKRSKVYLNDDILHIILSLLDDHTDLCRAAEVCKQWRAVTAREDLLRCLKFQNSRISKNHFSELCLRCPNVVHLNIHGGGEIVFSLVETAVGLLRNLKNLVVGGCEEQECALGNDFFCALEGCLALKGMTIMNASLVANNSSIHIHHKTLQNLRVIKCSAVGVAVNCPQVEVLSTRSSEFAALNLNCPQIHELDFNSFTLREEYIRYAVTSCPLLTSLDFTNCLNVKHETAIAIGRICTHLRVLIASNCSELSLKSGVFPKLVTLKLDSCSMICRASIFTISKRSLDLEVLEISNCDVVYSVSLNFRHLHTLKLVCCSKVADLSLESHKLSSITVSSCLSLRRISLTSNSLKKLVFQGLESLTTLELDCPCLQAVDLTGSKLLMDSVCDLFSDGGGFPALTSLVLDSCDSLIAVKLQSTSLISLSLVDCRAMISVELTCPYLKQGFFDGANLEKASFWPVGLESLNLGACPKLSTLRIQAFQLEVLELRVYSLSKLSVHCPRLISLDASFCSQLTDICMDVVTTPCLTSLILTSCSFVSIDGLTSLPCLAQLTLLDLSYTYVTSLEPIFESCLQLEVLKLQACKYLTDSSLEPIYRKDALPVLCDIDLSNGCQSRSTIKELLACCTRLTHVSLSGCVNMCDLDWGISGCQQSESSSSMVSLEDVWQPIKQHNHLLHHLNCVGCPNIKKVFIPAAVQWVHLSSLNLSLSVNLKEVDLTCFNMRFFNLSKCFSLETLKLDCPRLTSLFLQSCNIVEEAMEVVISHCSELETLDVRGCSKIDSVSIRKLRAACPSLERILSSF